MPALAAFWALIPTKDKLYGLLIILLLVGFGLYTRHERSIGAARVLAVQTAAAAKQAAVAAGKTDLGESTAQRAEVKYVNTINAAVIPDSPHLVVLDSGSAAAAVCAADGAEVSLPAGESTVEHPRDIGPILDKIGRDSDAEVTYLQSILQSCIDIGACKLQQ